MAILTFSLTHKLTGACISDHLSLLTLHCGPNNICLKTLYKFRSYFNMIGKASITCHYFCSICEVLLDSQDSVCISCNGRYEVSFFIEFPIVKQLQSMFLRPGFCDSLRFRSNRIKKNDNHIEDIYDGAMYQQLIESGFLTNPNNLSFFLYTDGISLYKSSKFSLWPMYLTINELNYVQRTQKENSLLAGLWFGSSKPNPNIFLKPLRDTMLLLESDGVNLRTANGDIVKVKCKLLGAVADLPAKAAFMRHKYFNGSYSCSNCLSKGERYNLEANSVQVFPYTNNIQLRNNINFEEYARQAVILRQRDPKASVFGVKGPTLMYEMLVNMNLCWGIDVMHGVFLNLMKLLIRLWFDPKYSLCPFSISALADTVDVKLKNIKPPNSFQRLPRSIKDDLALWKAADFKAFFFIYSLPCLLDVLPHNYWEHHCKIVSAIATLSQDSISHDQINAAEALLHSYVSEFANLYGLRYMGLNVHQLLHLPLVVRNLGPVWVYSCFFYENINGQISRLVHGSRHAALQICSSSAIALNLWALIDRMDDGNVKDFCLNLCEPRRKLKVVENIDPVTFVVGKCIPCDPVPDNIRRALENEGVDLEGSKCQYFLRLKRKGMLCTSEMYTYSKKKLSCFVEIFENGTPHLCKINAFIMWSPACGDCIPGACACPKRFFCIATLYNRELWEVHDQNVLIPYLNRVTPSNDIRAFPVISIRSLAVYLKIRDDEYIVTAVNPLEFE